MTTVRLVSLASLLGAIVACSNGPSNTVDASTEGGGKDSGTDAKKEAGPLPDSGPDDAGDDAPPIPPLDPQCTTPTDGGSGGACITLGGAIECNPITNAPCKADAGEACDFNQNGVQCYAPPPPNTAALCETCDPSTDAGPACVGGATCVTTTSGQKCARFCCNDTDCTPGHCDTTTLGTAPLGVCVK